MTSSLRLQKRESRLPEPKWRAPLKAHVVDAMVQGVNPSFLAGRVTKDKKRQRVWRQRIRDLASSRDVMDEVKKEVQARLGSRLPNMVDRMATRAESTGRQAEVKLALEATGVHNPRVDHQHGGDIQIHLNIPRPVAQERQADDHTIEAGPEDVRELG